MSYARRLRTLHKVAHVGATLCLVSSASGDDITPHATQPLAVSIDSSGSSASGGGAAISFRNSSTDFFASLNTRTTSAVLPLATSNSMRGDGKPDFAYNPQSGDLLFLLDGLTPTQPGPAPSFVAVLTVTSSSGILRPENASTLMKSGPGFTGTTNSLFSSATNAPGFGDGVTIFAFDLGNVLPIGIYFFGNAAFLDDLTLKYGVLNGGPTRTTGFASPEPSGVAVLAVTAVALMARRRRRYVTFPLDTNRHPTGSIAKE